MPRKVAEKATLPTRQYANGCIKWCGYVTTRGYGAVVYDRKRYMAHRYFWEQAYGPVPEGMVVHHRCGFKLCVNVEHLELVTPRDHAQHHLIKSHCSKGHAYTKENTYEYDYKGKHYRYCGICMRAHAREYQRKKRLKNGSDNRNHAGQGKAG